MALPQTERVPTPTLQPEELVAAVEEPQLEAEPVAVREPTPPPPRDPTPPPREPTPPPPREPSPDPQKALATLDDIAEPEAAPEPPVKTVRVQMPQPKGPSEKEVQLEEMVRALMQQNDDLKRQKQALADALQRQKEAAAELPPEEIKKNQQRIDLPEDLSVLHANMSETEKQNFLIRRVDHFLETNKNIVEARNKGTRGSTSARDQSELTEIARTANAPRGQFKAVNCLEHSSRFVLMLAPGVKIRNDMYENNSKANLAWLIRLIRGIYDAKANADVIARKDGVAIRGFPEFVYDTQRKQYGLPAITDKKTWTLVKQIVRVRTMNAEVEYFAQFLEESRSLDELVLFLRSRTVIHSIATGITWQGYIHDKTGSRNPTEYISLDRAMDVLKIIFKSSASTQAKLMASTQKKAILWTELPDQLPAEKWKQMETKNPRPSQYCIDVPSFLDMIVTQFREIELEFRHHQWATELFTSVVKEGRAMLDVNGFQEIFATAEPRYTEREIAQMYANLCRSSGTKTVSLSVFKKLLHQLMMAGVVFPVITEDQLLSRLMHVVISQWIDFRPFFDKLLFALLHSTEEDDNRCALTLKNIRYLLEKEMATPRDPLPLLNLYRTLLHVIHAHQASFMLSAIKPHDVKLLQQELRSLESIGVERHRQYSTAVVLKKQQVPIQIPSGQ